MSQNPTTPPEYSSTEDTPPDSLLARLRKVSGVTERAPLPCKADTGIHDGAPPVDRLILVIRDCFALLAACGIAAAAAATVGGIRLWSRVTGSVRRARGWHAMAAQARTRRAQESITEPSLLQEGTTVRESRAAGEQAAAEVTASVESFPAAPDSPDTEVTDPVIRLPAPGKFSAGAAHRFRRGLLAAASVLLLLPALWLVKPVRYYVESLMGRGNAAVIVAGGGWLFPRMESEPSGPPPSLRGTAAALRAQGATLVVVSVPAKSAVYPEKLTGSGPGELQRHPRIAAALRELTESGAHVFDLGPVLHGLKSSDAAEGFVFLPWSGQWSPRGMAQAAFAAASFIQQQPGYAALPLHPSLAEMTPATGLATTDDLVIALDSPRILSRYPAQTVPLIRLLSAAKKEPLPSDPASPVTLLGGESVRLYDDPSLGHPAENMPNGRRSSAGFAQHLAWHLSTTMEVHAPVRSSVEAAKEWLASRTESDRRAKRLIVWVLADADLLR